MKILHRNKARLLGISFILAFLLITLGWLAERKGQTVSAQEQHWACESATDGIAGLPATSSEQPTNSMNAQRPQAPTQRQINRNFMALLRGQTLASLPTEQVTGHALSPQELQEQVTRLFCRAGEIYVLDYDEFRDISNNLSSLAKRNGDLPALMVVASYLYIYPDRFNKYSPDYVEHARQMLPPPDRIAALPPLLRSLIWLVRKWSEPDGRESYDHFLENAFAALEDQDPVANTPQTISLENGRAYAVPAYDPKIKDLTLSELFALSALGRNLFVNSKNEVLDEPWIENLRKNQPKWGWFADYAEGYRETKLAWRCRNGKAPSADPSEFNRHCANARNLFERSWRARSDLPYAAAHIIDTQTGGVADEPMQELWAKRSMSARPDVLRCLGRYEWFALEPRWGGTIEKYRAFALTHLQQERYDTLVPLHYFQLLGRSYLKDNKEADWRQLWRRPQVQEQMDRLFPALMARPENVFLYDKLRVQYALVKLWMGRYDEAKKDLSALPQAQKISQQVLGDHEFVSYYRQTWQMVQNELKANTGPFAARIQEGERLVFAGKPKEGAQVWLQVIRDCKDTEPTTADYLRWRGELVQLNITWDDFGWKIDLSHSAGCWSVHAGNLEVVRWLIEAGLSPADKDPKDNGSMFYEAVSCEQLDILHFCMQHMKKEEINDTYYKGRTTLSAASFDGKVNMVRLLLDAGVNINAFDTDGETPLISAAQQGNESVVQLLLERGADPNRVTKNTHRNAIAAAASNGSPNVIALLLQKGVPVDSPSPSGVTALYSAVVNNDVQTIRYLLEKGADPEKGYYHKWNCLMVAVDNGRAEIVEMLLKKGADPERKFGTSTPLSVTRKGDDEILLLLKTAIANKKTADTAAQNTVNTLDHRMAEEEQE